MVVKMVMVVVMTMVFCCGRDSVIASIVFELTCSIVFFLFVGVVEVLVVTLMWLLWPNV